MGIFKRKERGGTDYYIRYFVNGQRHRKKIGPSKRLAELALKKIEVAIAENRYLDVKRNEKIKFKEFALMYIENHSKPNKRSWKTSDINSLKSLTPYFGEKYLYAITSENIEKYKQERKTEVSEASVNREIACLKTMFKKGMEWGKINEILLKT